MHICETWRRHRETQSIVFKTGIPKDKYEQHSNHVYRFEKHIPGVLVGIMNGADVDKVYSEFKRWNSV